MIYGEQPRAYNQARQANELAGAQGRRPRKGRFLVARGATDPRGRPPGALANRK